MAPKSSRTALVDGHPRTEVSRRHATGIERGNPAPNGLLRHPDPFKQASGLDRMGGPHGKSRRVGLRCGEQRPELQHTDCARTALDTLALAARIAPSKSLASISSDGTSYP